jgi:hypothetical protein
MEKKDKIKIDSYAQQFENQPTTLFKNGWKKIELPEFKKNAKDEVLEIKKMMNNATEKEKQRIKTHDKKEPPFELEFLKIVDADNKKNRDFIYTLSGQLFTICMYFKKKFNRIRPYKEAEKHGIEFPKIKTETGVTPSYPSGHAFNSHFMAEFLSKKFPEKKDELFALADEISRGRLKFGVHFPSDMQAGKILAKKILPFYKTSEEFSFKEFFSYFD